ncbi:MAG: hypothetical protein IM565_07700 [Pseudanabaena sp. M109S1SP2A07QC]|jgi:hypothetical protein|nr:hypothetical protein [Pseudanabaena sp. M109S1SP2A07QC]
MSTSDTLAILALLVSTFSLAGSLITLYFQFLRKTQTIKITLLEWSLENVPNAESILLLNLAFANLGNQTIVISKISLIFERNKENRVHVIKEGNDDPLILEPSDIRLENYRFACSEKRFSCILDQDSKRREIKSIIHFEIIDSKGKHYEKDVHGCIVKVENFKACGTSYIRNAQVELLK